MTRKWVPISELQAHLDAGWRFVYWQGNPGAKIGRPLGAVLERGA